MAWDSKGWHEYEPGFRYTDPVSKATNEWCKVCDWDKPRHMSKVDYVSMRLEGKRTPAFQFGFTDWKEAQAIPVQWPSGAIQPGTDIQAVSPAGVLQKTES